MANTAAATDDEKKASSDDAGLTSELGTKLNQTVASIDALLQQLTTDEKAKQLASKIKTEIVDIQKEEKKSNKENASLQTELFTLKKKFGALKWQQVEEKGYPKPRRDDSVVDVFKNAKDEDVKVQDVYRWLEDPDSDESRAWIEEQVDICNAYLSKCDSVQPIYKQLEENLNFERYSTPKRKGADPVIYYYTHNSGLQNQSVLYVHVGGLDQPQQLLLDPNTLSDDGTTSSKGYYFSEDGKYLCYGLSKAGSDWLEFRVKEVLTGKDLDDVINWAKFTGITSQRNINGHKIEQNADGRTITKDSFIHADKLKNQQLFYHRLGTPQSEDIFLIDGKTLGDEEWMIGAGMTYCGSWLELYISPSCDPVNRLYLVNISDPKTYGDSTVFQSKMIKLVDNFDSGYDCINNIDTVFYFKTNNQASNYRIISCDISKFDDKTPIEWSEVVAERDGVRLQSASVVGLDKLLLKYNEDVKTVVKLVDMKGNEVKHNIVFPAAGSVGSTGSKKHNEGFFSFSSFLYPGSIYQYDYSTNEMKLWKEISVKGFNSDDFKTEQVFYPSKDGTKIPMYIMSRKDVVLNGKNPTIIYGYGGFDISLNPVFSASRVLWLQHTGGVYVSTNLRGGGEYGEKWHKAGTKDRKQNVFDDFQSAAEYLIEKKYTNSSKLAIEGGSNGGLLVSACCNQRPELYRCGVANCGVLDMLRFHKFTIGYAWCSDYGCADNKDEFDALYKYSPLINIPKEGQYPCFMATTADHDDRVSPLHSFKFVAELQNRLGADAKKQNPLLIRIECKSGHGSSSLKKGIELRADTMAFIVKCLGAEWK